MDDNAPLDSNDGTWLTAAEVATRFDVSERTVRRACNDGRLAHRVKIKGGDRPGQVGREVYLIRDSAVAEWLATRTKPAHPRPDDPTRAGDDTGLLLELAMTRARVTELELELATNALTAERERHDLELRLADVTARLDQARTEAQRWRRVVAQMSSEELTS